MPIDTIYAPENLRRDGVASNVRLKRSDDGPTTFTFTISRATPIDRGSYREGLDHSPGAIRMDRFDAGAVPILFNHNWNDPRGMVSAARVVDDAIEVSGFFFATPAGRDAEAMFSGGMHNVSFGYDVHEYEEVDRDTFIARDWQPFEVSLAPVPADYSVGLSREKSESLKPVRLVRATTNPAPGATMRASTMPDTNSQNPAPDNAADTLNPQPATEPSVQITRQSVDPIDMVKAERERAETIKKLCRMNKIDEQYAAQWINNGTGYEEIADGIIDILQERGNSANAPAMVGMSKKEVREYSVIRALVAAYNGNWKGAGLEAEVHKTVMERDNLQPREANSVFIPLDVQVRKHGPARATRDLTVAGAPNLVGTDHLGGSFIELLRNRSVLMRAGATRLTGLRGNVAIPKMTAGSDAYWLATETTAITESTPTIGQLLLSPKNVAALAEISHQMLQQSDPSADQLILNDLARSVALAADAGGLKGDGTGGAPTGILNTAGIGSWGSGVNPMDYGFVLDAQVQVFQANAMELGNVAYLTPPDVTKLLMQRVKFTGTDSPIWDGNIMEGDCAGFPGMSTNQMDAATSLFGAFSQLILGEWGVLELAVNPNSNFAAGLTGLRAWYTMDAGVRHAAAFTADSTIT